MSKTTSKNQIEKQFLSEMGTELSDASDFDNLKLSEKVSQSVSENIPTTQKGKKKKNTKKTTSIFAGISDQIYGILSTKTAKDIILPSITVQKKLVKRSLERKKSKLISQAKKIRNARRFKANALEETIFQIRHIQSMIDDLFSFAAKKITELYKKHYLNIG